MFQISASLVHIKPVMLSITLLPVTSTENRGLGHAFLRHIERSRALLFVLDTAGVDGRFPWDDYQNLRRELELHQPALLQRKFLVAANKMDLESSASNLEEFIRVTGLPREKVLPVSARENKGLEELKAALFRLLLEPPGPGRGEEENGEYRKASHEEQAS